MHSCRNKRLTANRYFRLPVALTTRLVLSNVLLVAALDAGKDWLLPPDSRLGVFWVLIRILACGGLGVLIREGLTGELGKKANARLEVRNVLCAVH